MQNIVAKFAAAAAVAVSLVSGAGAEETRMLFLGNSITRHPPYPSIGWNYDWGMAATEESKDYVHVLAAAYGEHYGVTPVLRVRNIATFEQNWASYDLDNDADIAADIAFAPDVVVIAIGENCPDISGDIAAFRTKFKALCQKFSGLVAADKFLIRAPFWDNPNQDAAQSAVATELGVLYVDSSLCDSYENEAHDQGWAHSGIAAHPGDSGMAAIAAQMLEAFTGESASGGEQGGGSGEDEWTEPANVYEIGEYSPVDGIGSLAAVSPCAGGDEVRKLSNGEYVHYFRSSGAFSAPSNHDVVVQYLIVGGGGGGGGLMGGGGGAGAVVVGTYTIPAGETATIIVGAGGAGGNGSTGEAGGNGGATSIHFSGAAGLNIAAMGGGAGAAWSGPAFDNGYGRDGASGGGGGGALTCGTHLPGRGLQGHSGGAAYGPVVTDGFIPGGGGGAGTPGGAATFDAGTMTGEAGDGGDGVTCAITGVAAVYGTGGAGGSCVGEGYQGYTFAGGTAGSSGVCGGGPLANGRANTGAGGGGGGWPGQVQSQNGGAGGSGIAIVRYVPCEGFDDGGATVRQYGDYVLVDYIQSTGLEHINTGVAVSDNLVVDGEITLLVEYAYNREEHNQTAIVGGSWDARGFFLMTYESSLRYNVGDGYVDIGDTAGIWEYDKRMRFTIDRDSFSLNGGGDIEVGGGGNNVNEVAIFWVGQDYGLAHDKYGGIFRLHGLTMSDGATGKLLRDFRPVRRSGTGEYGLLDTVSGAFFGNASGRGGFTGGEQFVVSAGADPAIDYATVSAIGMADASFDIAVAAPDGTRCDIRAVYVSGGSVGDTLATANATNGINTAIVGGLKPGSENRVHFEIRGPSGAVSRYPASGEIVFDTGIEVWEYSDYVRLDGIKSTGWECIDTLVPCADDLAFELELTPDETVEDQNDRPIFGSSWDGVGYFLYFDPDKNLLFLSANSACVVPRGDDWQFGRRMSVSATKRGISVNDIYHPMNGGSVGTQSNIVLFFVGYNNYSLSMPRYGGRYTLHRCRISGSSGVLRDYYPALRMSTGEAGLLDVAHGEFYGNGTGNGAFIACDPLYSLRCSEISCAGKLVSTTLSRQIFAAGEVYAVWGAVYAGDDAGTWDHIAKVGDFAEGADEGRFTAAVAGNARYLRFCTSLGEWSETIYLPDCIPPAPEGLKIMVH